MREKEETGGSARMTGRLGISLVGMVREGVPLGVIFVWS